MIRVVIVDDHAVIRQELRLALKQQPDIMVVNEYTYSKQAIVQAANLLPDVVLLDILLPDTNSTTTIREIKHIAPNIQIIVFIACYADKQILQAIKAGALSFLQKDCSPHELVEAVYAAVQGECKLHPMVATHILREVDDREHSLINNMTSRELNVLTYIAHGCSHHEIAVELVISEPVVRTHVANILSKLYITDHTQTAIDALQQQRASLKNG